MIERVKQLIERAKVHFGKFGTGISEQAIANAERALKIPLPPSYKWWLENYGGGQIRGDVLYGIDEGELGMPDIVMLHEANERDGLFSSEELVFSIGNEEWFYFDTTEAAANGEYPVYLLDDAQSEPFLYAKGFLEFLERRITEMYKV